MLWPALARLGRPTPRRGFGRLYYDRTLRFLIIVR
jgi:hypothetical protein